MHPSVGPVPAFLVGWSLAVALGGGSLIELMRRSGFGARQIAVTLLAMVAALVVGSKLLYLAEAWPVWIGDRSEFRSALFAERLRLPGGFALAIAIGPSLARLLGVPYLRFADTVIPAAGLAILGIRIGCFLAGCCYGVPSSLPWAMRFPAGSDAYHSQVQHGWIAPTAPATLPVHPLQLYFGVAGLLIAIGLALRQPHKRYDGEVLLLFLLTYLWSTYVLEQWRALPHDLTRHLVLIGALSVTTLASTIRRMSDGAKVPNLRPGPEAR